nr:hypothetical protein CFP56_30969 [Quercus suber]
MSLSPDASFQNGAEPTPKTDLIVWYMSCQSRVKSARITGSKRTCPPLPRHLHDGLREARLDAFYAMTGTKSRRFCSIPVAADDRVREPGTRIHRQERPSRVAGFFIIDHATSDGSEEKGVKGYVRAHGPNPTWSSVIRQLSPLCLGVGGSQIGNNARQCHLLSGLDDRPVEMMEGNSCFIIFLRHANLPILHSHPDLRSCDYSDGLYMPVPGEMNTMHTFG